MTRTMRRILGFGALGLGGTLVLGTPALADDQYKAEKFQMMDTNKDGRVTPEEHAAGARQMFQRIDANSDGRVTEAEMDSYKAQKGKEKGQRAGKPEMSSSEKIRELDTNNDGSLSNDEYVTGSRRMFDRLDTNSDGYLVKSELEASHKGMPEQKPQQKSQQPQLPPQQQQR